MPNWCDNRLTIRGNRDTLNELLNFVRGEKTVFDFDKVIPYPEPYRSMDAAEPDNPCGKGYNSGGYQWCCNNWGTKWNAVEPYTCWADTEELEFTFDTAWTPPYPIIDALANKFPGLTFTIESQYEEEPNYTETVMWNNEGDT